MTMKFIVAQIGYGVFGGGRTEKSAVASANRTIDDGKHEYTPLDHRTIARDIGTRHSETGSWPSASRMTQYGEMRTGEMVLLTRAEAVEHGFESDLLTLGW